MTCYSPITAYRSKLGRNTETKKWPLVFKDTEGFTDKQLKLPCGNCRGCRLDRSREWAVRCVHEASLHKQNCFTTLTYSPEHLPKNGTLVKRDFQLFLKKLRKEYGEGIRFFMCGEYGEKFARPHYHACIFNHDFPDKYYHKTRRGVTVYRSPSLEKLWNKGISELGEVTMQSAAYTARYIFKKVSGRNAPLHYDIIDFETGEITGTRLPEYAQMSLRPGIGKNWLQSNYSDVYADDYVVLLNGMKTKPPRYYDKLYDAIDEEDLARHKSIRRDPNKVRDTPERLQVKEAIKIRKTRTLVRTLEQETKC